MYNYLLKIIKQLHFNNYILFIDNDIYRSFYAQEYLRPLSPSIIEETIWPIAFGKDMLPV